MGGEVLKGHQRKKNSKFKFLTDALDIVLAIIVSLGMYFFKKWKKFFSVIINIFSKFKLVLLVPVVTVIFLITTWFLFFSQDDEYLHHQMPENSAEVYVRIKEGMSAKEIGEVLASRGVIKTPMKFFTYAKFYGVDKKFHMGTYVFKKNMPVDKVIDILSKGKVEVIRFTIPEGYTVQEIAELFQKKGIFTEDEILTLARDFHPYPYIRNIEGSLFSAEGFLFPDTYELSPDATPKDLLFMLAKNFDERLTKDLRAEAQLQGLSIYDLIILASMVEKEAKFDDDRARIAQVFLKRLRIDMPLQSDATIQYVLKEKKEDMSISDTQINSPYNSYLYKGLPPSPIANPGISSIKAVLYPATTDYLYFVADREGHNHYAYTYEEHLSNVRQVR